MSRMKIALLVICTLILMIIIFIEPLRFLDNLFYDLNFAFSPKVASDSVAVVAFDSKSISTVGGWPWTRSKLAEVIDKIDALGPRVIALDILLPKRDGEVHNNALAASLDRAGNCVVPFRAVRFSQSEITAPAIPESVFRYRFLRLKNQQQLKSIHFYEISGFDASDPMFTQYSRYSGFLNVSTSNTSQKIREVLHVIRAGDEYFPSFALASVAMYRGLKPDEFILDGKAKVWLGDKSIPFSSYAASSFINFRSQDKPIVTVSALDILNGNVPREKLEGKLVFVGVDDPAAGSDFFTTPIASQYPGVKVWATAALDIFENSWLKKGGGLWGIINWLLALVLFPLLPIMISAAHKQRAVVIGTILLIGSIVIGIVLFRQYSYFWNPVHHIFAWLFLLMWIATQKSEIVTFVDNLELESSVDAVDDILAPPLENQTLAEIPQTLTAHHVLSTIVPEQKTVILDRNKTTHVHADDEQATVLLPRQSDSSSGSDVPGRIDLPDTKMDEFRNLCNGTIVKVLGSGGMADVYLVWNPRLELYRAVKVLKPDQTSAFADRFETEIRIFSKLDHPNIVHCYGVGEWHSLPYVEMEYVNGASLEQIIRKCGILSPEQTAVIGILICRALNYAHQHVMQIYGKTYNGVIHRDLKPANVMISRSGRVKLTDFGIARPVSISLHESDAGNIVGTLPYLSPEQIHGTELDHKTDIYALGLTLYELLAGKRAFPQKNVNDLIQAKKQGKIESLIDALNSVPEQLQGIIRTAVSADKEFRYHGALEMGVALEEFLRAQSNNPGYVHLKELMSRYWA
ncbi:CHASE2 domain-containing protein [candidate division KSB1 bacterium]|nr:CHASE2 domain-containing protein [candidate division KSB1 bacterium]